MKTHFCADLHLDHENVLAMSGRLFPNILEHDNHMIAQINRYVPYGDRLFILGDVAWHSVENYLDRLLCKDVHLIWGNHDKKSFGKHFKSHQDVLETKIGKKPDQKKVFLSHYPHAYWPSSHHGSLHLYGHCHRQREETLDRAFPGRRSMDCGVDNALHLFGKYRPFTEDEIIAILANQPGHDMLPFYADFQAKRKLAASSANPEPRSGSPATATPGHEVPRVRPGSHPPRAGHREKLTMDAFNFYRRELKRLDDIGAIHWSMVSEGRKQLAEEILELESNSTIDDRVRRKKLKCSHCPSYGGENKTYTKRGVKRPKYKKKRK